MKYLKWEITNACNLRCSHCLVGEELGSPSNDVSLTKAFKIIDEAYKLGGKHISLLGGEPLARKDIHKIVGYAVNKGMRVSIVTNGILLTSKLLKELNTAGLSEITISIDGPDIKTYEFSRGKGKFSELKSALHDTFSVATDEPYKGPIVNINTVLEKSNSSKDTLIKFFSFFESIPVNLWRLLPLQNEGLAKESFKNRRMNETDVVQFSRDLFALINTQNPSFSIAPQYIPPLFWALLYNSGIKLPWSQLCCDAASDMIHINGKGDISGCDRVRQLDNSRTLFQGQSNINNRSIKEVLVSNENLELYKHINEFFLKPDYTPCKECQYLKRKLCEPCALYSKEGVESPYYLCKYAKDEFYKDGKSITNGLPMPNILSRITSSIINNSNLTPMPLNVVAQKSTNTAIYRKDGAWIIYQDNRNRHLELDGFAALVYSIIDGQKNVSELTSIVSTLLNDSLEDNTIKCDIPLWMASFKAEGLVSATY